MLRAALRGRTAPLTPQDRSRAEFGLADKVLGKRQRCSEQFPTAGSTAFWQRGGGEDQVRFGDQVPKSVEFTSGWLRHDSTIRAVRAECKRSLFSIQRTFQTLPGSEARSGSFRMTEARISATVSPV